MVMREPWVVGNEQGAIFLTHFKDARQRLVDDPPSSQQPRRCSLAAELVSSLSTVADALLAHGQRKTRGILYALCSILYTPYSILYTPYSVILHTLYSIRTTVIVLYTPLMIHAPEHILLLLLFYWSHTYA